MKVYVYVLCLYILIIDPLIDAYRTIYARRRSHRAKAILQNYYESVFK